MAAEPSPAVTFPQGLNFFHLPLWPTQDMPRIYLATWIVTTPVSMGPLEVIEVEGSD